MDTSPTVPRSSDRGLRPNFVAKPTRRSHAIGAVLFTALFAMALAAGAANSDVRAGTLGASGVGASGIQTVNLGDDSARGEVKFMPQGSAEPIVITYTGLLPGAAHNSYLPSSPTIPNGAYSTVSWSDQPMNSLAQTNWLSSGGAAMYTAPDPALDVIAPFVAIGYDGMNSIVSIQNTDETLDAVVDVSVIEADAADPAATDSFTIAPGRSISLNLATLPPFSDLGASGFIGALRAVSADVPIAVHAITDVPGEIGIFDYEGLPSDSGEVTLHNPRFRINEPAMSAAGELRTFVAVSNPGVAPVDVNIDYLSESGTCDGSTATRTVTAGSMTFFDDVTDSGLASGCSGFSAVQATGDVLAMVLHREVEEGVAQEHSAHRAISTGDASEEVFFPNARNKFLTSYEVTSDIFLTNPSAVTATVEVSRFSETGDPLSTECPACGPFEVSPGVTRHLPMEDLGWPEGTYGHIRINSDEPVAATLFDVAIVGGLDTSAHTGIARAVDAKTRYHPLVLNAEELDTPPATLTATTMPGTPPTAAPTATPGPPEMGRGMSGAGSSGVILVNRDETSAANITASFQRQGGGAPTELSLEDIAPRKAANIYLPTYKDIENGTHALLASSDQSLGGGIRTDWLSNHSAIWNVASAVSKDVIVPMVTKAYDGRTSYITIQNTHAVSETDVLITVNASDGTQTDGASITLAPGDSETVRLSDDSAFSTLPASFIGSLVASADVDIAVHAMVEDTGYLPRGVFDAAGLPVDSAVEQLFVPRFSVEETVDPGMLSTWISVVNPGDTNLDATVTYAGERGTCVGESATHSPVTLLPGGMTIFDPADVGLSPGCGGHAIIESTGGGVLAHVVHDSDFGHGRWNAAHTALADGNLDQSWYVSVFRRRFLSGYDISSEVTVMNPGDTAVDVTLGLKDETGAVIEGCAECDVTIAANASHIFSAEEISVLPDGVYGSASIESDGPVAVLLQEFSRGGVIDSIASVPIALTVDSETKSAFPLSGKIFTLETDPPPPPPTPTPTPTPSTFSITINSYVDVSGAAAGFEAADSPDADEACPACDLSYDDADREAAIAAPLPVLEYVVKNGSGEELGRATTLNVGGVQVATIDVVSPPVDALFVTLVETPDGWTHCPNQPSRQHLTSNGPDRLTLNAGFHFSNICVPDVRGRTVYVPYVIR